MHWPLMTVCVCLDVAGSVQQAKHYRPLVFYSSPGRSVVTYSTDTHGALCNYSGKLQHLEWLIMSLLCYVFITKQLLFS